MAFGVYNLQLKPRCRCDDAKNVDYKKIEHPASMTSFAECRLENLMPEIAEAVLNQPQTNHEHLLFNTAEVAHLNSAPEPEFEVEVESSDTNVRHHSRSLKINRRLRDSQISSCKSSLNRRPRFWAKHMKRRRMCLFDGSHRTLARPRCTYSKRCNVVTTPFPARVDAKVLQLLQKKRKQLKRDGLYQFVLWREALKAERNRLMESRSFRY